MGSLLVGVVQQLPVCRACFIASKGLGLRVSGLGLRA